MGEESETGHWLAALGLSRWRGMWSPNTPIPPLYLPCSPLTSEYILKGLVTQMQKMELQLPRGS